MTGRKCGVNPDPTTAVGGPLSGLRVVEFAGIGPAPFAAMLRADVLIEGHRPGTDLLDDGAPFYDTYRCADGRYVAIGPLEPRFHSRAVAAARHR
jgi:alpha-methylacyl-CoA racemase